MSSNTENDQPADFNQAVLVLQIICAGLMFGVVVFGIFTLLQDSDGPANNPQLTYFALFEAIIVIPIALLIPRFVNPKQQPIRPSYNDQVNPKSAQAQIAPLQIQKIIQYALLEGSAFFCLVAYFIERHSLALLSVVIILFLMVVIFPTHASVTQWLRRRREMAMFEQDTTN